MYTNIGFLDYPLPSGIRKISNNANTGISARNALCRNARLSNSNNNNKVEIP